MANSCLPLPRSSRSEYIQKAIDKFVDAQARLEARNQPRDLLGKAVAQFHVGYCQTLLGYFEEAGASCQGAYTSATDYLLTEGTPVRAAWDQYMEYESVLNTTFAKRLGKTAGIAFLAAVVMPPRVCPPDRGYRPFGRFSSGSLNPQRLASSNESRMVAPAPQFVQFRLTFGSCGGAIIGQ